LTTPPGMQTSCISHLPPTQAAASSAALRKAGVRLARDAHVALRARGQTRRAAVAALLALSLVLALRHVRSWQRAESAAAATLRDARPRAWAAPPAGDGYCACADGGKLRRATRVLQNAEFVARVVFEGGNCGGNETKSGDVIARVHTLFKGPPIAALFPVSIDPAALHACLGEVEEVQAGSVEGGDMSGRTADSEAGRRISGDGDESDAVNIGLGARLVVDTEDAGYGDGVDRSFLIVGGISNSTAASRAAGASTLGTLPACGAVWAMRWAALTEEVRDAIVANPAVGDPWWRDLDPWPPISHEWWGAHGRDENLVVPEGNEVGGNENQTGDAAMKAEKPNVSIVAACKDRPDTLPEAAESWVRVRGVSEIVLVDWSSERPLRSVLSQNVVKDRRLFIATAPMQSSWVLTRAYNIALRLSRSDAVLKVDCDTVLEPEFLEAHPLESGSFYSGDWRVLMQSVAYMNDGSPEGGYSEKRASHVADNQVHVNGILYAARNDLLLVGGYDERVVTYGWDDSDISSRLARTAENLRFNYSLARHVPHDDKLRTSTQRHASLLPSENPLAAPVEIQRNRILLTRLGLPPWTIKSPRVRWNVGVSPNMQLELRQANILPPILEAVSANVALDVSKRAIRLILLRHGISLLPKTLSLAFYKLLATQVGFPDRYAELLLQLHGGCASRIISLAASQVAAVGATPDANAVASKPVAEQERGEKEEKKSQRARDDLSGSDELLAVAPPAPFSSWRLRLLWRQPDIGCTCRFNNVFEVPDVEVLATAPMTKENVTSVLVPSTNANVDMSGVASAVSTDVRTLLHSAIRQPGRRVFFSHLLCDVEPKAAPTNHKKSLRATLRRLRPSAVTRNAVLDSLRRHVPSIMDDADLALAALPVLIGDEATQALQASLQSPEVHAMAAAWGASSIMRSRVHYHLDHRAISLAAAVIAIQGDRGREGQKDEDANPNIKSLARRVGILFQGCPGQPRDYLQEYPELTVLVAGLLSANVCLEGINDTIPRSRAAAKLAR
jgi:hypothetical protein